MTYNKVYEISNLVAQKGRAGLTLFEAHTALTEAAAEGHVQDSTAIIRRKSGEVVFVGFWSGWHQAVRAGFQSSAQERELLNGWSA